jgi:hypothetical protein
MKVAERARARQKLSLLRCIVVVVAVYSNPQTSFKSSTELSYSGNRQYFINMHTQTDTKRERIFKGVEYSTTTTATTKIGSCKTARETK